MSDTIDKIKTICTLQEKNEISEQWALHQIGKLMHHDHIIKDEIEQLRHDVGLVEHPISQKIPEGAIGQREHKLDELRVYNKKNERHNSM